MIKLRTLAHDLTAPIRVKFQKQIAFKDVQFKYFANSLGTFRSINTNEPRSVDLACHLQNLGIKRFLDVGSSFGVWSLPFLKFSDKQNNNVSVLAVDAHALSCQDLFRNAEFNNLSLDNLLIVNSAIGTENGFTNLFFPKYSSNMGSTETKNPTYRLFNEKVSIPKLKVDFFFDGFQPDFVKIDIEGLDLQIASDLVKCPGESLKVISVEVTPSNLRGQGLEHLQGIAKVFPYVLPIPKEYENGGEKLSLMDIDEVAEACIKTRKSNVFFFRDLDTSIASLEMLNS